ncbi:MAG: flagellar biosynthesis anti-sigma factor FlgM [Alicyclobacillus herbarius]|uniref:flagellar biosynthesis anti-sigma factor FlgM n=1 Tax=Alicyclobacillus herbarius TaxID=122960 RepID=UPI0004092D26|nr:flagellar biosynthesis anti-sigma factor FlgM [Alicyclobacillus herbarius]MCL6633709.1 flagellar biosynthesis anti-sigma factor FlgM [Alicyclobacillus herbarius]
MRIGDTGWGSGLGFDAERVQGSTSTRQRPTERAQAPQPIGAVQDRLSTAAAKSGVSTSDVTNRASDPGARADRVAALKRVFQSGQPLNLENLADKLLESGVLFSGDH